MSEDNGKDLAERLRDSARAQQAIDAAVREAVRTHKLLGRPIVTMRDGQIVWIPPEEIELPGEANGKAHAR
jgi:hypothetical protein